MGSTRLWEFKRNSVHEVSHQENSPAGPFEEVLGRQRVGEGVDVEAGPLVDYPDPELAVLDPGLDSRALVRIEPVAVLDRVRRRFPNRQGEIRAIVAVEAQVLKQGVHQAVEEIQLLEPAGDGETELGRVAHRDPQCSNVAPVPGLYWRRQYEFPEEPFMSDRRKRRTTAGIVLILVGLAFFFRSRFSYLESEYLLLGLGAVFMVGYLWRRRYGLVIPGGILLGLGAGGLLEGRVEGFADGDQLGLGLGFLAVFLVPLVYQRRSHWWPLIPGGVLILAAVEKTEELAEYLVAHWPLVLVAIGIGLVLAGWRGGTRRRVG